MLQKIIRQCRRFPLMTAEGVFHGTGYWTRYTYDLNDNLTGVIQNAQPPSTSPQTRMCSYDWLSRLTSETNPDIGGSTTSTPYTYDTDSPSPTSKGDKVKRVDAVGNVTCFAYDALHRNTSVTYPSGSYASVTPAKYFVYDAATVNSVAMSNAKGRLAEAYTGASKTTDLGFSYSVRGETANIYESTPHSGGYYNVAATYWPSGLLNTLNPNLCNIPVWKYIPDGEGRVYSVSASSGQVPVTGVSYNAFSQPLSVTYGSSDADNFDYDANTGRMLQYFASVNNNSVGATLNWNANGSRAQMNNNDPLNSANTQICNYAHDDLSRLATATCANGSTKVWGQNFSFDPFGNTWKSNASGYPGTNFAANYTNSPQNNRYSTLHGGTPTYDSNGNLTNDTFHTYSWDSDANLTTLSGNSLTYDAFDRRVEYSRNDETYKPRDPDRC